MQLSNRKLAVLSAVIKNYIQTGEPVGSKALTELLENAPSSATLRNEMNALCGLGFLSQPHTSAGRTPTVSGYKLYISSLMQPQSLAEQTQNFINRNLCDAGFDTESISKSAAEVLHRLTGYPIINYNYISDNSFVEKIKLLPINRKTAIMLLILSDGRTKNNVCRLQSGFEADIIMEFTKTVNNSVKGKKLNELNRAHLQSIIASAGINGLSIAPLLSTLFSMIESSSQSTSSLCGSSALYNFCNDEQARNIIIKANRTETFEAFNSPDKDIQIIFGNDTAFSEFENTVIITSKYYCNDEFCGNIGIIGPDRMNYEQIIPSVEYISKKITALITDAVNDMED